MDNVYQCPDGSFKSPLKEELASYIQYKVNVNRCKADSFLPKLKQFDRHCIDEDNEGSCLKREAIMGFLQLRNGESRNNLFSRAYVLHGFLDHMSVVRKREGIYQLELPQERHAAYMPYIFSHNEIRSILNAAEEYREHNIPARSPNIPNSMQCILTVLYCTGMRISETLSLEKKDVDLDSMLIHINHAKNDNCRIVTISVSLGKALHAYLGRSHIGYTESPFFFFSGSELHNGHISVKTAYSYFRRYLEISGIEHRGRGHGPRLHDLRGTFAVHSLQKLSEMSGDVNAYLA